MSFCLIILAAGNSSRFRSNVGKPYQKIGGKSLIEINLIKALNILTNEKIIVTGKSKCFESKMPKFCANCLTTSISQNLDGFVKKARKGKIEAKVHISAKALKRIINNKNINFFL